jgi:hypothetical protein
VNSGLWTRAFAERRCTAYEAFIKKLSRAGAMFHGLNVNIDTVQTAALIVLTVVVTFAAWRSDQRFAQQHYDIQDAIRGQYAIIKQFKEQHADLQAQIDRMGLEMDEKCRKISQRLSQLEGA